jgi:NAD(P)H-flavin reductase
MDRIGRLTILEPIRITATFSESVPDKLDSELREWGHACMSEEETRKLIITGVQNQGRDIRSFDLMPAVANSAHGVTFIPGQVAVLRIAQEQPAYFAFASAPEDDELEILVKRTVGASVALFEMSAGDEVELVKVAGHGFDLNEMSNRDLVFVAMGTGVAPLRSALRHVLKRKDEFGQLVVLYGARTPDDFCYRDETDTWEDAGVELRQVISRPGNHDWSGPTGYVQSLLDHVLTDLKSPVALVCGSREMIAQTRDRLQQMGFAADAILTNY